MKKILTFLIILVSVFTLTSCAKESPEEIFNEAMDNMENADNLRMYVSIFQDSETIYEVVYKTTGDVSQIDVFGSTFYYETINESTINILSPLDAEKPTIAYFGEEAPSNTFDTFVEERYYYEDFVFEDFTYEDGVYKQSNFSETITFLRVTISDGYIKEMYMEMLIEGELFTSVVMFKNYGVTTITLPNYLTEQTFIDKQEEVTENTSFSLTIDKDGFELSTLDTTFYYIMGSNEVRFDSLNAKYHPAIESIFINEQTYNLDDYLALAEHLDSEEVFALVKELFNMYFD